MQTKIRKMIGEAVQRWGGDKKFIIYPFGNTGMQVKDVLNIAYGI